MLNYFWIRIFDYKYDDELQNLVQKEFDDLLYFEKYKGTLLDEYYLCGDGLTRAECKNNVTVRSSVSKFAKARNNQDCIYAIVMESDKFYYDRYYSEIDTICFNPKCNCKTKGKAKDFPSIYASRYDGNLDDDLKYYFCSYECRKEVENTLSNIEGEWQSKEDYSKNGGVYGYIYHIYNRKTNKHYVGQTLFMPFFRWQEHVKSGLKGNICDLVFETITEVRVKSKDYLNSIEAWWIKRYINDYGRENVINITVPNITINDLMKEYETMIEGQLALNIATQ